MEDLSKLGQETDTMKFIEEYNALCDKYGLMLNPVIRTGLELIEKPVEAPTEAPTELPADAAPAA